MTTPEHFSVLDGHVSPQPWMQLRHVVGDGVPGVSKSYDPADGAAKNEMVQNVQVDWTNNTPVKQWVYGLVTRDGCQVTLQTRSRAYLETSHGVLIAPTADADDFDMQSVSKFGVGADVGKGGLLALGSSFSIAELRQNTGTIPLMPHLVGWFVVEPGEKFNARVEVAFKSDFWENTPIDGGDNSTEAKFIAGELQIDLFAVPTVAEPPARGIPTIVGGAGNITHDVKQNIIISGDRTTIDVPADLAAGDVLLAVVCNQFGAATDIVPFESGWYLLHDRNNDLFGLEDVHMKVMLRPVPNPGVEPATYSFGNGLLAEEIAVLIPIRGAAPFDPDNMNWFVASNLQRWKLVEEQIAPSVSRSCQLLLAASYFNNEPWQSPISQTPPAGMTELVDIAGGFSTFALAALTTPPNPTLDRQFTPSAIPIFTGHSITASILIPGAQTFT